MIFRAKRVDFEWLADQPWSTVLEIERDVLKRRRELLAHYPTLTEGQRHQYLQTKRMVFWTMYGDACKAAADSQVADTKAWIKRRIPSWVEGAFCTFSSLAVLDAMAILNSSVIKNPYDHEGAPFYSPVSVESRERAETLIEGFLAYNS